MAEIKQQMHIARPLYPTQPMQPAQSEPSGLFVLSVREQHLGRDHTEWRGEMLDVDTGAVASFDDWPELVDLIAAALHNLRASAPLGN